MKHRTFWTLLVVMILMLQIKGTAYAVPLNKVEAAELQTDIFSEEVVWGTVYLCDYYEVKATPESWGEMLVAIPAGSSVQLLAVDINEEGVWCRVRAVWEDTEYEGYILRSFLAVSNASFLEWEQQIPTMNTLSGAETTNADIEQFPPVYQSYLKELKEKHPNWIFVRQNVNMDWDYVIENELKGSRSLIGAYRGEAWKKGSYSTQWAYASKDAVEYCMDPRNFLNEISIFQFEQLTYNASYHGVAATQNILQNTFMHDLVPGSNLTYAQTFVEIGEMLGVSPFHIASRVAQEQGRGTSPLISGTYPGFEGYYNYFNIGASGNTDEAVYKSGLTRAKQQGWTSPYLSIKGGAAFLASTYIMCGQDTLYLQKFDVDSSHNGVFSHQYMQNIEAPGSEAKKIFKAYQSAGAIENTFVFKIPVYNNMPATPCVNPDIALQSVSILMLEQGGKTVVAGAVTETNQKVDLEYRWLQYDIAKEMWSEIQGWTLNSEWCNWTPPKTGDYLFHVEVRIAGTETVMAATVGYHHKSPDDPYIKGMCQMPYAGEGGGYLIGVETDKNPEQKLQYELLILDCTLLAEGKDAWVWTTGKCRVADGNAFWAVWQPEYGYYWTLFRVFDEEGNMLDEECYGFENI